MISENEYRKIVDKYNAETERMIVSIILAIVIVSFVAVFASGVLL